MTKQLAAHREPDDAELMRRVQNGDNSAFGALYGRLGARAYRIAYGFARDGTRAEDIVQEAFLSVWRSRSAYQPQLGSVASWVMGTVRNRSLDSLRRDGRHDTRRAVADRLDQHVQVSGDLEEAVVERDQAQRLRGALTRLPAAQREVIALAYFGELSASEIARELALPMGTVKGRMRLGLKALRFGMQPET